MSTVSNRMYQLCVHRCERYERGDIIGNGHHLAQLLAKYAEISALSNQQYQAFMSLKGRVMTAKEVGLKMKRSSKHASAILKLLMNRRLVTRDGLHYQHDASIKLD